MSLDNAILTAIISAVVVTLPGVLAFISQRRKDRAELDQRAKQAISEVIELLKSQMADLAKELNEERAERKAVEEARESVEEARRKTLVELRDRTAAALANEGTIAQLRAEVERLSQSHEVAIAEREAASRLNADALAKAEAKVKELQDEVIRLKAATAVQAVGTLDQEVRVQELTERMSAVETLPKKVEELGTEVTHLKTGKTDKLKLSSDK